MWPLGRLTKLFPLLSCVIGPATQMDTYLQGTHTMGIAALIMHFCTFFFFFEPSVLQIRLTCGYLSDMFTSVSKVTDIRIKPRQHQTSIYGSTDFRDHWYWESDPFDTGAA